MKSFKKNKFEKYLEADQKLTRILTSKDLIALGIGAVIGTGIFIQPGHEAASHSGPAIIISFAIAAFMSALIGMVYAEFSSTLPIGGGGYSFGNILFGEIIGWGIGWLMLLEYFLSASSIAVGFSSYFNNNILPIFGINMPKFFSTNAFEGGGINITAIIIILIVAAIVSFGVNFSKIIENISVVVKIMVILVFVIFSFKFINKENYKPFYPKQFQTGFLGLGGILKSTSTLFFSFTGFESLSSYVPETKDPEKNVVKGIFGTLALVGILYTLFAIAMIGAVKYTKLGVDDPASFVLNYIGLSNVGLIITIGALFAMFTAIIALTMASSKLVFSISRDGLLPKKFSKITNKKQTNASLFFVSIVFMIMAGNLPLQGTTNLMSAAVLVIFAFMSFSIPKLRALPDVKNKGFKIPLGLLIPIVSGILSLFFLINMDLSTMIMLFIWLIIGIIFYLFYGIKNSHLQNENK